MQHKITDLRETVTRPPSLPNLDIAPPFMAADLGEFPAEDTETHPRPKRRSFAQMGHDNPSPVTASPISAPTRTTPPHAALSLDRPILENYMTPSPPSTNTPGMAPNRQFGGLDHDIAKFAQSVRCPFFNAMLTCL